MSVCACVHLAFFYFLLWISHYWPCGNFSEHYNNNRGSSPRDDCNISSQRQYLTVTIANAPTSQAFRGAPVTPYFKKVMLHFVKALGRLPPLHS